MEALEQEVKVGKRLASNQVNQLKDAIKLLLGVMGYVGYEDNVDRLLTEVEAENEKQFTRYDPSKTSVNKPKPSGGSGKGGANWSAAVGQTIIGNLARGEGGRFISAANITSMMNQLNKENISPDMFTAMQDLLNGKEVSGAMLKQLQAAGLATEDGQGSVKAMQILTAMKTGEPDKLKQAIADTGKGGKPGKGGGKGSKPPKPPKPTKDEIAATNIEETGLKIIEQGRLTDVQMSALNKFANGETVDNTLMNELVDKGLVEIDENGYFSFSTDGNRFWGALEKGDLRKALDALNKSEAKIADALEARQEADETLKEQEARIQAMKDEFVRLTEFPELENFLKFANGEEVDVDFSLYGLTELDTSGKPVTTKFGKQLAIAIQKGKLRDAIDAYRKAGMEVSGSEEKNFTDDCNLDCNGFKVFEAEDDAYLLTWTTNSYRDREGEYFTLKAIEDYVARNVESDDKGTHQFWHIPGSDFTDIVAQTVAGKFLVEIGRFRKDEIGQAFKEFFAQYPDSHPIIAPDGWGNSHGFVYKRDDRQDAIYEWFDKKETTVLPIQEAANVFTWSEFMIGEKNMELNEKQVAAFDEIGKAVKQPNLLQKILAIGKKKTEVLDGAGFDSKAMKTEDGYEYPERCFLYVPDSESPSTWKLRICAPESTEVTREQLGAAAAAFSPGGFRGQRVELPRSEIRKVKDKLKAEYAKLGVKEEDMPQSIKEVGVKELEEKFAETSKACATDMRKKMDEVLATMEKEDGDKVEMLRQLSELVAQVQEEELRNALTEIVTAMQAMYTPVETEEEEVVEEEMPVEEEVVKELDTESIAKALKLDQLSDLLEAQQKAIDENKVDKKALEDLAKAMVELSQKQIEDTDKYKVLFDELVAVKKELSELKKEDEVKVAEKQARFTPYWGSRFQASKAAETVLGEDEAKEYRSPEVPSVIQSMSRKFMGGK